MHVNQICSLILQPRKINSLIISLTQLVLILYLFINQFNKQITIHDKKVKMEMVKSIYQWDTAGQQRFKIIVSSFYRGSDGILIVYDITDRQSFQQVKIWNQQIQKQFIISRNSPKNVVKILVGNKKDNEQKRKINFIQGNSEGHHSLSAAKLNISFRQVSAKTGENINKCFHELAQQIYKQKQRSGQLQKKQPKMVINQSPPAKKQQDCCQFSC